MRMKWTRQFDQMDCGPACIRMVASYYGKDYPLSYLRSLAHLTREGVSVAGIRDALKELGAESATFAMTLEQLRGKCPLPAILHWEQNHFVVLYDVRRSRWGGGWRYCVADPAYGRHVFRETDFAHFWLNGDKGVVVAIEPTDAFFARPAVKEKHSFVRFARKYVWPFRWEMSQSAFGMFFGILLSLVTPFLTQAMVDEGIGMRNMGLILNIMLAQIFLFVGTFSMGLISSWVTLYMSTRINIHILGDYLTKLLRLPMTFFETKSVGDYQQRLGDHARLQGFVTQNTVQTFFSLVSAPFYLLIIGWYSPLILLVYFLLTGLGTAWMTYFFRRRKVIDYEQFKLNAENQNKLYELMSGITDIKLNGYEDYKIAEWREMQERQYRMSQRSLKLGQVQSTGFAVIGQLRNIIITCWIAAEVVNGNLTLGMMMSISAIIGQVNGPLSQLISFLQQFQDAKISLERSEEVHLCRDEDGPRQLDVPSGHPLDIELRHLTFSYTGRIGRPALEDVSFTIPAGRMTAIVGESGSGKTTLLNILAALDKPTGGTVLLGGKNLSEIPEETAAAFRRDNLGFVFQDFSLLDTFSLEDNICLPLVLAGKSRTEMRDRLSPLAYDLGIETLLKKYPYEVSGGQKQRAAVARALITRPQILLADEPTGALDSRSTDELLKLFGEINASGQTIVMVTHSVRAASCASRVLFLRDGEVSLELKRGKDTDSQFYQRITDALTQQQTGGECA